MNLTIIKPKLKKTLIFDFSFESILVILSFTLKKEEVS